MSSKLCLILFGALVALAVFATAEQEENSLSEDVAFSRLVREADAGKQARKAKKGGRKNKRNKAGKKGKKGKKAKKGRKGKGRKGKGKKKGRKGKGKKRSRKGKGKKRSRKGKKKARKNMKGGKRGGQKAGRQGSKDIDAKCVAQLTLGMRRWKDVVTNFKRQYARITDNKKKGSNKGGKKGLFAPIALKLVSVGGGNKSALECGGQTTGSGAEKITQLAKDLFDCEKSINASCNPDNFPKHDEELVEKCEPVIERFEKDAEKCMKLSKDEDKAAEGCACWTGEQLMKDTEAVNECKVTGAMQAIKAQLKGCVKAFGACRTLEDEAVSTLSACSADPEKLKKKAAALNKNKKALEEVKKKVEELKAGATAGKRRLIRAPATDCAGIIALVQELVTVIGENPSSPKVAELGDDVAKSTGTCSASDVAALEAVAAAVEEAAAAIEAALEQIQKDLEAATGTTASADALEAAETADAATEAATEAAGGASDGAGGAGGAGGATDGAGAGGAGGATDGAGAGGAGGATEAPPPGSTGRLMKQQFHRGRIMRLLKKTFA